MAVSDGVFDEGTFDNATFNNITRSENFSVNSTAFFEAQLFRSFNESVALEDADVRQIGKVLTENTDLVEDVSRESSYFRDVSESLDLTDEETLILLKNIQEALSLADETEKKFLKSLADGFSFQDDSTKSADLFRSLTDSFTLQDNQENLIIVKRVLQETVGLSDEEILFLEKKIAESAGLSDTPDSKAELYRSLNEQFLVNESQYSLDFDDENDFVSVTDSEELNPSTAITISFWFKTDSAGGTFWKGGGWGDPGYTAWHINQDEIKVEFQSSEGNKASNNTTVPVDEWAHFAVRWSLSDGGEVSTFVNGEPRQTSSFNSELGGGGRDLLIGKIDDSLSASPNTAQKWYGGEIDDVRVYSEKISESGIQTLASDRYAEVASEDLAGWWVFNRGDGDVVEDVSGQGNDGVINGATWNKYDDNLSFLLDKALEESLNFEDVSELSNFVELAESVGVSDDLETTAEFFKSLTESLDLDDADIRQIAKTVEESFNLSDETDRDTILARRLAETLVVQDNTRKNLFKVLVQALNLADDAGRDAALFREFTENIGTGDQFSKQLGKSLTEDLVLDDNVLTITDYVRRLSESLDLSDDVVADLPFIARTLEETVTVEDTVSIEQFIQRIIEESFELSDEFATQKIIIRELQETLDASDELSKSLSKVLSESFNVEDATTSFKPGSAFASEVDIEKLHKAVTNITATRKAVVDLEKKEVSDGSIDKF